MKRECFANGKVALAPCGALPTLVVAALCFASCNRQPETSPQPGRQSATPPKRYVAPLFDPKLASILLDEPQRNKWQKPEQIVRTLQLRKGQVVADVGAGSGYLLPYLSRAVGKSGVVYAQEVRPDFLPELRRRARTLGNVRVVLGQEDDTKLPARAINCFVLLTVYHEVQQPVGFLKTLHQHAQPGARLVIIDFDAQRRGSPRAPIGHEVAEEFVVQEARAAGWKLQARHNFISSQFFLVFTQ